MKLLILISCIFILHTEAFAKEKGSEDESTIDAEIKVTPTFQFKKEKGEKSVETTKAQYPTVILTEGQVEIHGKDDKALAVKRGLELKEKALIITKATGQVAISLGGTRKLLVLANSEVSLPSIGWESGEVPLVTLKKGSIFWQDYLSVEKNDTKNYPVAMTSGLYQFIAPPADFILSFMPDLPRAEMRVIRGELVFSAMNAEESVSLTNGEKADFFGVLENSEIAYDLLLKGKKIPRGQLSKKSRFEVAEYLPTLIPEKPKEDPKIVEARKKAAIKKKLEETRTDKFICIKPRGQLNQCLWRLEAGKCYRSRCNAGGEWADTQLIQAASVCKKNFVVGVCDY